MTTQHIAPIGAVSNTLARRGLFGGGAALLALAEAGGLAAATPPNPDAELLRLSSEFLDLHARLRPILTEFFSTPVHEHDRLERLASLEAPLAERQDELADQVVLIQARTQEGMAAKAAVAKVLFTRHHKEAIEDDCLSEENAMAWSLFQDLVGRA